MRESENKICLHCSSDLSYFKVIDEENPIEQLFWGKAKIEQGDACFNFVKGEKTQKLIHDFKYKGNKKLAHYFGELMSTKSEIFNTIDLICPVPSTNKKTRKRGYNQAEELAKSLAKTTNTPMKILLKKKKEKGSQTSKDVYHRHLELSESFTLNKIPTQAKHILLIDDVITSGATLNSCAEIIEKENDVKISVLALAFRNI